MENNCTNEGKWNESEVEFLKNFYPTNGLKFCMDKLNRSWNSVRRKVLYLKLKKIDRITDRYEYDKFLLVIQKSKSYKEVARNLGIGTTYGNRQTIKRYIEKYNIDNSHFDNGYSVYKDSIGRTVRKRSLSEILVEKSDYVDTRNLKNRLYKEGLNKRECELCGQGEEWQGKKMSLILDHINGVNNDNRIENLRIVCPNCNATLDTFSGKNNTRGV